MNRKLLVTIALIAIALILAYRYRGFGFDWTLFFSSFRQVRIGWLAASVVATFATYVVRAARWQILLAPLKAIRLEPLLVSTLVGFSAIYVLGRLAEPIRPVWLSRRERISTSASLATVFVERFLDAAMLMVLFVWTLMVVELPRAQHSPLQLIRKDVAWVLAIGLVATMLLMYLFRANIDGIVKFIPFPRVASLLHNFAQGLSFLQRGSSFSATMFYSLVLWIIIAVQFWFMMLGMNLNYSISAATFVMVAVALGSVFQIPGIGGGFQAAFISCLGIFFAVPAEQAVAGSVIAYVFSFVPTVGITAVYMLATGLSFKDLRLEAAAD
jgi:glycosyltransferase 2 family protein